MASNPVILSRRQNLTERIIAQLSGDLGLWLYLAIVLVVGTALAFAYLAQASYAARQIETMVELEQKLSELHEQNSVLRLQVAGYEDITRIKSEARAMGLGEAAQVEYVEVVLDEPATPGGTAPSSKAGGDQSSALSGWNSVTDWPGVRFVSVIARQFQAWISRGVAGLGTQ